MNGIKMSDCKFYIDEGARTVICVIPHTKNMLIDFIQQNFSFRDLDLDYGLTVEVIDEKLKMPHSFMGKAVCAPEDEWNEETGRLIAYSRAKDKCYKSFFKRANQLVRIIDERIGNIITKFNELGMKLDTKKNALETKINSLVQKE